MVSGLLIVRIGGFVGDPEVGRKQMVYVSNKRGCFECVERMPAIFAPLGVEAFNFFKFDV